MLKNNTIKNTIITLFVGLYAIVATVSTIHLIDFFLLSNPYWLAVTLAVAFEIGAAASLASIIILDKTNRNLVWFLFILITVMQVQGNMFYTFMHLENFESWSQLFSLESESIIYQKRILSIVSGGILPIVALGFIKSLVDYIWPKENSESLNEQEYEGNFPQESENNSEPTKITNSQEYANNVDEASNSQKESQEYANNVDEASNSQEESDSQEASQEINDASSIMGLEEENEDKMEKAMREKAEKEKKNLANNS